MSAHDAGSEPGGTAATAGAATARNMQTASASPRGAVAPVVEAVGLSRDFVVGGTTVHALRGVDLAVSNGELVGVRGRSGSGKTTLLNLLGGLDRPTAGRALIDGRDIAAMTEPERVELRRRNVSFIFQAFGLIPYLSAAENVEIPLRLVREAPAERDRRVHDLLRLVGLAGRANHRPMELSGGEQQRVAIARALASNARLLLADEPTGQLDSETGHRVMELLREVMRERALTAVVATHDPHIIDLADRVVELRDGALVGREARQPPPGAQAR